MQGAAQTRRAQRVCKKPPRRGTAIVIAVTVKVIVTGIGTIERDNPCVA